MRSSLRLIDQLRTTWAGERLAVLFGNVGDLHMGPEGTVVGFEQLLAFAASADGRAAIFWSPGVGTAQETPPGRATIAFSGPGPGDDAAEALRAVVAELDRCADPAVVFLDWADVAFPRLGERSSVLVELLGRAITDPVMARRGHRFAVIDRSGVAVDPIQALPSVSSIAVPLPDLEERLALIELVHRRSCDRPDQYAALASSETVERMADVSGGVSIRRLLSLVRERAFGGLDLDQASVRPVKRDSILQRSHGALRQLTVTRTFEQIAGLSNVRLVILDAERSRAQPPHLLLAGPPGTGKSSVAGAFADALGLAAVALGDVRSQWLGESERQMREVIRMVSELAPVVLFVDEIDQVMGGDSGGMNLDSGVSGRINSMFWEWTGGGGADEGVIVVGATNRPDALGARVEDRFTTVPVLHPDPTEGARIIEIAAADDERTVDNDAAIELLSHSGATFTGRTLVEIYRAAVTLGSRRDERPPSHISGDLLASALESQLIWNDPLEQEIMALSALRWTRSRRYLPWKAAHELSVPYTPPGYVERLLDADGVLDTAALQSRLSELERAHARH